MKIDRKSGYIPPMLGTNNILLETGFTIGSVKVGEESSVKEEQWEDVTDTGSYDDIVLM